MPACGPRRGFIDGLVWPSFSINNSRPSRGAFPFSTAENLFDGTIGAAASNGARGKKQAEWEEMSDGGSAPLPIYQRKGEKKKANQRPHDHK